MAEIIKGYGIKYALGIISEEHDVNIGFTSMSHYS